MSSGAKAGENAEGEDKGDAKALDSRTGAISILGSRE